jgi:4-diphosphocytidyl-2-C-methyl-D-erythritol kinase
VLEIWARAKINLTLEVLDKRRDGFHEIRSVIQAISLGDCLRFQESDATRFSGSSRDWVSERSLVSRAVNLIRETTGCDLGVTIEVDKRIPLSSGLGGDSSDAAATLRGLNRLWSLGLSQEALHGLAAQLGSDVPFFLYGGTALLQGRGDLVTPLPSPSRHWIVVVLPDVPRSPNKTGELYQSLTASQYTGGEITERLIAVLKDGGELASELLGNTFEQVAFARFAGLDGYRSQMLKVGAGRVHLAGSGPALFTLVNEWPRARDLCLSFIGQGIECYFSHTLPCVEKSL